MRVDQVDQVHRALAYGAERGWHGHTVVLGRDIISEPGMGTGAMADLVVNAAPCVVRWTHLDGRRAWTLLLPQGGPDAELLADGSGGEGPLDGFGD